MGVRVALCLDELTCRNPELIGLDGESLDSQEWLEVFATGESARRGVGETDDYAEAWVVSCEDVDPINLAATLKSDRPTLPVTLVVNDSCGSLFSRAHTASIDEVLEQAAFPRRYAEAKRRYSTDQADETVEQPETPPTETLPLLLPERSSTLVRARHRGFLMPVVSGSGGAGKSTVSVISAFIARDMGYKTLLLDYDLQFGDAALMAGIENPLTVDRAIAHPDQLEREITRDPFLTVLAAPERLEQAESVVRDIPDLLDSVSGVFDVVIANTGGAWAEQHAVLLERSYTALFLIDQRASSIRACRHALELCIRCGIATGPFEFVVNRCAKGAPLTSADVSCALQGVPVYELKDGGRDVEDYLGGGAATELLQSGNAFCESLQLLLERLLPSKPTKLTETPADPEPRLLAKRRARHANRKRGRKP